MNPGKTNLAATGFRRLRNFGQDVSYWKVDRNELLGSGRMTGKPETEPLRSPVPNEAPDVLGFGMPQDITIPVVGEHTEVRLAGRVPTILDGYDLQSALAQVQPQGALIGFEARIGLYAHELFRHSLALLNFAKYRAKRVTKESGSPSRLRASKLPRSA
jgi:hypothetical protein